MSGDADSIDLHSERVEFPGLPGRLLQSREVRLAATFCRGRLALCGQNCLRLREKLEGRCVATDLLQLSVAQQEIELVVSRTGRLSTADLFGGAGARRRRE